MMYLGEEVYRVAPRSVNTSVSPASRIQASSLTSGTWRMIRNTWGDMGYYYQARVQKKSKPKGLGLTLLS